MSSGRPDIVRLNETELRSKGLLRMPSDLDIIEFVKHPGYRARKYYHDIALLRLSEHISVSAWIRPACLWQTNAIDADHLTALGYGLTEYGSYLIALMLYTYITFPVLRWKTVHWINEGQTDGVSRLSLFA